MLKTGKIHMALKLAINSGDTNAMMAAVEALGDKVDPELANTLAAHLRQANQHSHAAALLATAGKVMRYYCGYFINIIVVLK